MPGRERLSVWLLTAGFAGAYALIALHRHWHFDSSAYDLGIFDQVVWKLSRFEVPASSIKGISNIFGDHFHPILVLFVPVYWIWSRVEALLVAQSILLALSIVPVYAFLRGRLAFGPALALSAVHGLFWGMQRTAAFDVHELAFAPLLIAGAVLSIDRRRWAWLWLSAGALLLVKEDVIPVVGALGLYLMWLGERRRGAALVTMSLLTFGLAVLVVIPYFSDAGFWNYGESYAGSWRAPWLIPLQLVTPIEKLRTVLFWLAPFLFLPLGSPLVWLAVPVALSRLLSPHSNHWGHGFHYSAPLAPILAMAAGDGLARLAQSRRSAVTTRRVLTWLPALCVVVAMIVPGRQPMLRLFTARHYQPIASHDAARAALATIPPDASVVAQAAIVPHLSQRSEIYMLDVGSPSAEFVVASSKLNPWPLASIEDLLRLVDERRQQGWVAIFEADGWVVLRRPAAQ